MFSFNKDDEDKAVEDVLRASKEAPLKGDLKELAKNIE